MLSTANPEMLPEKKLVSLTSTVTIHVYLMKWIGIDVDFCLISIDLVCTLMTAGIWSKYLYKSILSSILVFGIFYM